MINLNKAPTNAADTARPPKVLNEGLTPLVPEPAFEELAWPDEPVCEAVLAESVVVPAMSGNVSITSSGGKQSEPTLLKVG